VTCRQQLPEGTENHPGYFAQYHLKPTGMPPLETAMNFSQELKDLLRYLQALTAVLPEAQEVSEDIVLWLGYLARELAEEALRRREWLAEELDALYEAANGQVKGAREAGREGRAMEDTPQTDSHGQQIGEGEPPMATKKVVSLSGKKRKTQKSPPTSTDMERFREWNAAPCSHITAGDYDSPGAIFKATALLLTQIHALFSALGAL